MNYHPEELSPESRTDLGQTTCGDFASEKEAERYFDENINSDYFIIEKEVKGRRLFDDKPVDPGANGQKVRVDRILHPTPATIKAGWRYGPIAVEIKNSNIKLGPVFTQIMEYRQSIYISTFLGNTRILPMYFAIFPVKKLSHDLHSLQQNQLILSCCPGWGGGLKFSTGNHTALIINHDGINVGNFTPTTRKGHRGTLRNE